MRVRSASMGIPASMESKLTLLLLTAMNLLAFQISPGECQTTSEVHAVVAASHALGNDPFTAGVNDTVATIYAYLPRRANRGKEIQEGCKVKALLAAKAVMDKFKNVAALNCYFLDPNDQSRQLYIYLEVHTGDIRSYSNHSLPLPQLLASLSVKDTREYATARASSADQIPELKGKMGYEKRAASLRSLVSLQEMGQVDVKRAIEAFRLEEKYAEEQNVEKWLDQHNTVAQMLDNLTEVSNKRLRDKPAIAPVKQGDFYTDRMTIYALIDKKKKAGQDTNKFEVRFSAIEAQVGGDKEVLKAAIDSLLRALY